VAAAYEPFVPGTVFGAVSGDVIEPERRRLEKIVEDALARFDAAARRSNLSSGTRKITGNIDSYAADLAGLARRFDLVITGQPEARMIGGGDAIAAESLLFESGRPLIVVPSIQKIGLKLDRVMVCWDGSRAATRAIADALPFLVKAKDAEIVTMKKGKLKSDMVPGADLAAHLARHDIKVRLTTVPGGDIDAANALLSHAADSGADFIVMGGYGHSRLREFVLGGVTRTFLESMPVPTLMSH
jgi:nucleotide-binding universal stress UspA family protein